MWGIVSALPLVCRFSVLSLFFPLLFAAELKKETRKIYPERSPAVICVLTERAEGGKISKTEASGQMSL